MNWKSAISLIVRSLLSLVVVAFELSVGPSAMPARGQDQPTLHVVVGSTEFDAEAYYAADLGFFKKAGLNVEITRLARGPEAVAGVVGGTFDIGDANTLSLAAAVEHGISLKIIAPGAQYSAAYPTTLLVVPPDSPIHTAKDLNGKAVAGIALHSLDQLYIWSWVDKNGGDVNSLKFTEIPLPEMVPALLQGRVAAASVTDPFLSIYRSKVRVLARNVESVAPNLLITAYFTRSDWGEKNPTILKAFSTAIGQAAAWANKNPGQAAKIIDKYLKIDETKTHVYYAQSLDPNLLQPILDGASKYGILSTHLNARDLLGLR